MLLFKRLGVLNVKTRVARLNTFEELLVIVVIYRSRNFKQAAGFVNGRRTQCKSEYNALELEEMVQVT